MAFVIDVKLDSDGRMVLPRAVRDAMGVAGETRLIVTVEGSDVRLSPLAHVVTRLQALYREHASEDADTAAFLEERRRDDERVQVIPG